jgi:uncharacterized protein YuzB (UPF0349 family)
MMMKNWWLRRQEEADDAEGPGAEKVDSGVAEETGAITVTKMAT